MEIDEKLLSQTTRTQEGVEVTDEAGTTNIQENNDYVKSDGNNSVIKQGDNATLLKPKKGVSSFDSGAAPGASSFKIGSYSGESDKVLVGDTSSSQNIEKAYNPDGRFRTKVDQPIKDLNDIVSEQVKIELRSAPALDEDRDATEGFKGRLLNDNKLIQKVSGTQVAQKEMARSVDEILRDELYYMNGQNIEIEGSDYLGAPREYTHLETDDRGRVTEVTKSSTLFPDGTPRPTSFKRGNYVPKFLNVNIKNIAGKAVVTDYFYDVDDHSIVLEANEQDTLNMSASHARIHGNVAEIIRQQMEDKAGNESLDGWNPLARAIAFPTANVGLLKDIETETGNTIFAAHRKTSEALAYQINRAAKDGLHPHSPINEMVIGNLIESYDSEAQFEGKGIDIFSKDHYKRGAASLIINMFDSTPKYDSKGAILNLKRKSFAGALNIAEVNASNFKASQTFVDIMNTYPVFSTINKGYDPLSPVMITDNINLSYSYNFRDFIEIKGATENYYPEQRQFGLGYSYQAPNNKYLTRVDHPLLSGIYDWFVQYANNILRTFSKDLSEEVELRIPINHSMTKMSLWSLLVLHASKEIARERLVSCRELLDYENIHGYPFQDTVELKTLWNTSALNYGFKSIDEPMIIKRMDQMVAQTWVLPEQFIPYDEISDSKFRYISPFYFNEENFTFRDNGTWQHDNEKPNYSFPIIRAGVTTDSLENMVNMKPYQIRLAYDMMTRHPIQQGASGSARVYKYDLTTNGIFSFDDTKGLKYKDILVQPRQLGLVAVLPYGYATPTNQGYKSATTFNTLETNFSGGTSFRAKMFYTSGAPATKLTEATIDNAVNQESAALHLTATNLKQSWVVSHAGKIGEGNIVNGVQLSLSAPFDTTGLTGEGTIEIKSGIGLINPFTKGNYKSTTNTDPKHGELINISSPLHLRLNILPFIVSPWDSKPKPPRTGEEGLEVDPYMFAHIFNFVGYYAIDWAEEMDIRLSEIQDSGPYFASDRWVNKRFGK